jgi:membrane protease YdiL (CAAX protease family)
MAHNRFKIAVFVGLITTGFIGCLIGVPFSIAVLDYPAAGGPINPSTVWLRAILEAVLILTPASAVGLLLGKRIGLGAIFPCDLDKDPSTGSTQSIFNILVPSLIVGVALALPGLTSWLFIQQTDFGPGSDNPTIVEWLLRSMSAALTEEIAFRYGLMTLLIWLINRIVKSKSIRDPIFWIGNAFAALVFAGAHLPPLLVVDAPNWGLVILVFVFNGLAGMVLGWIFLRYSLMAAILAHFIANFIQHVIPRILILA